MATPQKPYRELTPAALITGVLIGSVMTAAFVYVALKLGFTLPGSTVAAIMGYNEAKRWSKTPEEFGTGTPEGIAGPEAGQLTFEMVEDLLYEDEEDLRDWLRGLLIP